LPREKLESLLNVEEMTRPGVPGRAKPKTKGEDG